ncbi:ABC transporter permease subunit [Microterricola viridarii]|uniref:ABC-2 type transport system permease protein n=1 Tax=Microterricola viridarii TaxID=412690 RepID=A0A0X8E2J1_9MICO|nr:ABC transporter permease subunit [Microterricola viridarii]AMB58272.1 hypothetical protein AWU67_04730 [Microterricola viridarii]
MSTTALTPTAARQQTGSRLSFGGVIRSEWIKLRSLRSTVWSYLIVFAIALGMAFLMSSSLSGMVAEGGTGSAAEQRGLLLMCATFGVVFGQLVVAVLGVLVISGEYSTGMIRSTLTAVPRRLPALAAKGLVLLVSTFVVGALSTVGAFLVSSAVLGGQGVSASLTDVDVILPLLGAALYLALVSLVGLGIGAILRNSAGGIATILGLLLLLPMVLQMIPTEWAHDLLPYALMSAGMASFGQSSFSSEITSVPLNLLIVLAWVTVSLIGAAISLKRRDA